MIKEHSIQTLNWKQSLLYFLGAVAAFHVAYSDYRLEIFIVGFLFCLLRLSWQPTARRAFYLGLAIGFAVYAPHLEFFWEIFGWTAAALWFVLSFWLATFLLLSRAVLFRFGRTAFLVTAPFLWTGLEFFRSELYYLRFTWLNVGYVFSNAPSLELVRDFGVYGIGFMLVAALAICLIKERKPKFICALVFILLLAFKFATHQADPAKTISVAGIQLLYPTPDEAVVALDKTHKKFPNAELFLLCEYSFHGPIPDSVKAWCKQNKKYLVVGGEDPGPLAPDKNAFYDTAFVIDPNGGTIFKQGKCVPVQFFNDGLPAREQKVWNSPWGKIGFCVCYDLSYSRVTDELIRQGAQAIIVPTLDPPDWGEHAHRLHARVTPMRSAEYGVPIFRVDGCGISQLIHPDQRIEVTEPFPADGAMIGGDLRLAQKGRVPFDRWLARASVVVTAGIIFCLMLCRFSSRGRNSNPKVPLADPTFQTPDSKP